MRRRSVFLGLSHGHISREPDRSITQTFGTAYLCPSGLVA